MNKRESSTQSYLTKRSRIAALIFLSVVSTIWLAAVRARAYEQDSTSVSYVKDVQPIFDANCVACHSNSGRMSGLSLENYDELMKGGTKGHAIIAGDSAKSRLVGMIEGTITPKMPPGAALKPEQIKTIRAWIDAGAHAAPPKKDGTEPAALPKEPPPVAAATGPAVLPEIKPRAPVAAPVTGLAFHPGGELVAAVEHKTIRIIDRAGSDMKRKLSGAEGIIRTVSYSPDGKLLAAGGGFPAQFGEITIWDTATGQIKHRLQGHRDYIYSVAFSPDKRLLASSSYDRLVKIWDIEKGVELKTLKDHTDAVYPVAFSPDGKLLASGAADRTVKVWDVGSGKRLYTLSDSLDVVYTLAFHPSGKQLTAAGADKNIRTWTITEQAGTLTQSIIAHTDEIVQIAYSPDGSRLASTSADRTVKLWDLAAEQAVKTFEKQPDWSQSLAWSPDGQTLVVGGFDGAVRIYNTQTGRIINTPLQAAR